MKKLVRLDRILEEAEERGEDPSTILVNPDGIFSLNAEENPEGLDEGSDAEEE